MAGHPRVAWTSEQLEGLRVLARSERRDEADRARAMVLSINGWTSGQIARAFGVTPDSVRRWRCWFAEAGVDGLRASDRPGCVAVKSEAAASVAAPLLTAPVTDRTNWTLPRLQAEIARQAEISISKSQLSKTLKKTATGGAAPAIASSAGKIATPSTARGSASSS